MSENSTKANGAMVVGEGSGGAGGVDWNIPSVKSVEKFTEEKVPLPDYAPEIKNIADSKNGVVQEFENQSNGHLQRYINQSARKEFETYLDDADAKFRMSQLKGEKYKTDSTQKQNTLSQLPSGQYYETIRIYGGALQAIMFGDEQDLPARYEPIKGSLDYTEDEGKRVAKGQNACLKDVWEREHWSDLIKESVHYACKNAHEVLSMEWEREVRVEKNARQPGYYTADGEPVVYDPENPPSIAFMRDGTPIPIDENNLAVIIDPETGRPKSYVFADKERVVKDNPVIERKSLKNIYWDLDIDGFNGQTCVVVRGQKSLEHLLQKQKSGLYKNVEKLGSAQLFTEETKDGSSVAEDQDDNADQPRDREANGLYDIYHVYMYAPIKEDKWDKDAIPVLWEAVYAGDFGTSSSLENTDGKGKSNGSVCLMLRENPYNTDDFPYKLIVSHPDDRGSLHMGFYTLLEANVEEQCITINQLVDNKTLAIKAPFLCEQGAFLGKDAVFRDGNQILWRAEGSKVDAIKKVEIPNMTQNFVAEMDFFKTDADNIVGTNDAIRGVAFGSRTTGTEYLGAKDQALKPVLEHAKYMAKQYFHWILPRFMSLSRQFADPDRFIEVDGEKIYPAELYGELETKVVSIEKYEADLQTEQVYNNSIQSGAYDKSAPFMGEDGALQFWRNYYRALKMQDVNEILPGAKENVEAKNQVNADIRAIWTDPQLAMVDPIQLPKEGEAHQIHIDALTEKRDLWVLSAKIAPPEEKELWSARIAAMDFYIQIHEQMMQSEQAAAQASAQASTSGQADQVPVQEGEAAGDTLAGIEGQIAPGGF